VLTDTKFYGETEIVSNFEAAMQCFLILLVKIDWKGGKAFGSEEGKAAGKWTVSGY
jgi:hypothetical protein